MHRCIARSTLRRAVPAQCLPASGSAVLSSQPLSATRALSYFAQSFVQLNPSMGFHPHQPPAALSTLGSRAFSGSATSLGGSVNDLPSMVMFPYKDLNTLQEVSCKEYADRKLFGTKDGSRFNWTSFGEFGDMVTKFRAVLRAHEIGVDDKVALICNNRLEWAVAYFGIMGVGAQIVPMYEAQTEKDWNYIIHDSEAKLVITANESIYEKVAPLVQTEKALQSVLCLDTDPQYMHSYDYWMEKVSPEDGHVYKVENPEHHLATIIYTSGTTGNPKGVELSHTNIVSNIAALDYLWEQEMHNHHTSVCFLPWAHVFGQVCELNALIAAGSSMAIAPNREALLECIDLIKPTMMCSVPILFNKVYDGVQKKFSEESNGKQKLIKWAFDTARARNHALEFNQPVSGWLNMQFKIADKIVLSKVRERLGGRLVYMGSGGAATSLKVLQFFEDIGVPITEGYGLTETSPVITSSKIGWTTRRLGCVGVPLDGVTVKITDPDSMEDITSTGMDGEICVAGPNVMKGYRKNKAANDEVFFYGNGDGKKYFKTGDMGRIVDGKFLKITGRIKEQYKLENGKYVVPAPLEDIVCRSHFVNQCLLFGDNRSFNVLLVVPDFGQIRAWVAKYLPQVPFSGESPENDRLLLEIQEVQDLLTMEIQTAVGVCKNYEKPRLWAPIFEAFSQENHMLTPKMSVRRKNVLTAYMPIIEDMYAGNVGMMLSHPRSDAE